MLGLEPEDLVHLVEGVGGVAGGEEPFRRDEMPVNEDLRRQLDSPGAGRSTRPVPFVAATATGTDTTTASVRTATMRGPASFIPGTSNRPESYHPRGVGQRRCGCHARTGSPIRQGELGGQAGHAVAPLQARGGVRHNLEDAPRRSRQLLELQIVQLVRPDCHRYHVRHQRRDRDAHAGWSLRSVVATSGPGCA